MAACMRHERISDALELLARYLTTFDNQLFKLQKALRAAQDWRLHDTRYVRELPHSLGPRTKHNNIQARRASSLHASASSPIGILCPTK